MPKQQGHKDKRENKKNTTHLETLAVQPGIFKDTGSHHKHHHHGFKDFLKGAGNVAKHILEDANKERQRHQHHYHHFDQQPLPAPRSTIKRSFEPLPSLSGVEALIERERAAALLQSNRNEFMQTATKLISENIVDATLDTLAAIRSCILLYNSINSPSQEETTTFKQIQKLQEHNLRIIHINEARKVEELIDGDLSRAEEFLKFGKLNLAQEQLYNAIRKVMSRGLKTEYFNKPIYRDQNNFIESLRTLDLEISKYQRNLDISKNRFADIILNMAIAIVTTPEGGMRRERYTQLALEYPNNNSTTWLQQDLLAIQRQKLLARHQARIENAIASAIQQNFYKFYMQDDVQLDKSLFAAMYNLIANDIKQSSFIEGLQSEWRLKHSKSLPYVLKLMIEAHPITSIPTFTMPRLFGDMQFPCFETTGIILSQSAAIDWRNKSNDLQLLLDKWEPMLRQPQRLVSSLNILQIENTIKITAAEWQNQTTFAAAPTAVLWQYAEVVAPPVPEATEVVAPTVPEAILVTDDEMSKTKGLKPGL